MSKKNAKRVTVILFAAMLVLALFLISVYADNEKNTVYLRNGGQGDGFSPENAVGDFEQAVRLLADSGGKIVVCGKYSFNELIFLSEQNGTANKNKKITVTSVHNGVDYRSTENASFCIGDGEMSANIILAGDFVFENLNIVTDGSEWQRAIICGGNETVFGEGIICKKQGKAPYISIVGVSLDEDMSVDGAITIKSGTYNYVCAGSRNGSVKGNTSLVIDGGRFEGAVSASGIESGEKTVQDGDAYLTINGGSFYGEVGALTGLTGDFFMTVNGGTFEGNILALGIYNTLDINGGKMQKIKSIKIADVMTEENGDEEKDDDKDDKDNEKETEVGKDKQEPEKISSVNINSYSGDVNKLVKKIEGKGVVINVNTEGGTDDDVWEETDKETEDTKEVQNAESTKPTVTEKQDKKAEEKKEYFLGSRTTTIIVNVMLFVVILISLLILVYRAIHRK